MPTLPTQRLSDETAIDHLLLLFPNLVTRQRVERALAFAGVAPQEAGTGLRVNLAELDMRPLLEGIAANLTDREKLDTRIALIPTGGDERTRRKATALARPLASILQDYCDSWLTGLLEKNALQVHFQPLVQYPPGRVHAYECLMRGVNSTGQLIPPATLLRAARNLGLQSLLDRAASRAAVSAAADVGFSNVLFFINLLHEAIEKPQAIAQSLQGFVEVGGLRPDQIAVEFIDSESARDTRRLGTILDTFRNAGFALSLDDVGAGGASLLPLGDLHPDYVKIDTELFGKAAELDATERRIFLQLCEQARQCGAIAIVKGVETEYQLRFAIDAGVRVTQGFIHARPQAMPLDAEDEDRMLRQARRTAVLAID